MSDELREAIKASIEDSLVQLGRGSGITPEQRARMVEMIARSLFVLIDEAAIGPTEIGGGAYTSTDTSTAG